jgi:hypothetical protein
MEILKKLGTLIEQATSDSHNEPPVELYAKILTIIQSRVDMYIFLKVGPSIPSTQYRNDWSLRTRKFFSSVSTF